MDFTDDSFAQRRSLRLQQVAHMEATAVGKRLPVVLVPSINVNTNTNTNTNMNTNTDKKETETDNSDNSLETFGKPTFQRNSTREGDPARLRRPTETEIRSLWRLKVMQMKLDVDASLH